MIGWAVALKGDSFDLHLLTEQFRSPEYCVSVILDCYELQSLEFDVMNDPTEVRDRALELIHRLNGAAKLIISDIGTIEFGCCVSRYRPDGSRELFLYPPPICGRSHASLMLSMGAEDPEEPKPLTASELRMITANRDESIARALRLFGYERSWDTLFKVYEVVAESVGNDVIKVSYPNGSRLAVFTSTANNRLAVGDGARHGHERHLPPANPMELHEAARLVGGWLAHWIEDRQAYLTKQSNNDAISTGDGHAH